eukprot:329334-Pyramimonas_sp.AAC.1
MGEPCPAHATGSNPCLHLASVVAVGMDVGAEVDEVGHACATELSCGLLGGVAGGKSYQCLLLVR